MSFARRAVPDVVRGLSRSPLLHCCVPWKADQCAATSPSFWLGSAKESNSRRWEEGGEEDTYLAGPRAVRLPLATSVPQPNFLFQCVGPRGHLAMCGDIFGRHNWRCYSCPVSRGQGCCNHPIVPATAPTTKNFRPKVSSVPRLRIPTLDQSLSS